MKIVIAGYGKVGSTLTRQLLAEGYDLTIIDSSQSILESGLELYDVMAVHGNCATMDVLTQAGIKNADLLIATTDADELNLLCCMTAHGINPNVKTIARIRNPEYNEQIYLMRDTFALSLMVNPERQAAMEIERLIKYPGFLKREAFAHGRVEIAELRIDNDSKLCNVPLSALNSIVKCRVLVCMALRNGAAVAPNGSFVLNAGDRIFVTAPTNNLATMLKNIGVITHKVGRVMIVGGGRISYYLAQCLQKSGISVQLIEKSYERCVQLAGLLPNISIVHGDASNLSFLEKQGLASGDALVTITGLDELNMVLSLYGKSRGVRQIITKLGRTESMGIINSLSLGSVICPKELSSNTIVGFVRAMKNQTGAAVTIHSIADGQAEAVEFIVDESTLNCGIPLKKLKLRRNVLVACILHGSDIEIPNGDSVFSPGDTIIIITSGKSVIYQLNDIFE